jgi:putative phosphoesterase
MRVLLLADTHGVLDPRIAALSRGCDYALHAGDIGSAAVLTDLQPRHAVVAVCGNNDTPGQWPSGDLDVLSALPERARLELPGGAITVVHGHRAGPVARRHDRLRADDGDCRLIVYGHSHRMVIDTGTQPWVINPGAAGRSRTFGGPSCVLLTARSVGWSVEARRFSPQR